MDRLRRIGGRGVGGADARRIRQATVESEVLTMTATKGGASRLPDRYLELVVAFPLRPIRSAGAHQRAKRMLRGLGGEGGSAVEDYKHVLVKLIAEYRIPD